ncbi:hypothetical protein D3C85_1582150 [compost metagenome]
MTDNSDVASILSRLERSALEARNICTPYACYKIRVGYAILRYRDVIQGLLRLRIVPFNLDLLHRFDHT